jgi:hypothetical protein
MNTNLVGFGRPGVEKLRPAMLPDFLSATPRLQHYVHQRLGRPTLLHMPQRNGSVLDSGSSCPLKRASGVG